MPRALRVKGKLSEAVRAPASWQQRLRPRHPGGHPWRLSGTSPHGTWGARRPQGSLLGAWWDGHNGSGTSFTQRCCQRVISKGSYIPPEAPGQARGTHTPAPRAPPEAAELTGQEAVWGGGERDDSRKNPPSSPFFVGQALSSEPWAEQAGGPPGGTTAVGSPLPLEPWLHL